MFQFVVLLFSGLLLLLAWLLMLGNDPARGWHGFLISYLFFTSLAGGLVTWPAVVLLCNGRWPQAAAGLCRLGLGFAGPSLAALVVLWIGSPAWAPWHSAAPEQQWWLNNTFLFGRNFVSLALFWFLATRFSRDPNNPSVAGWLLVAYVVAFSLMGFDLVMSLRPDWVTMMIGGYFFVSASYLSIAAWMVLTLLLQRNPSAVVHDQSKLLVTFSMLTAYLMYCHLLPIWYGNIPAETSFLVPRLNLAWRPVSYGLVATVYLGPMLLLMPRAATTTRSYTLLIAALVLIGMWVERWWLVSAVFAPGHLTLGWPETVPFLAFGALLAATMVHQFHHDSRFC